MTHNPPKGDEDRYKPLTKSVDPNDKKKAFINTVSDKDHLLNFGSKKHGFDFAEEDKKMVRKIIKTNKKSEK